MPDLYRQYRRLYLSRGREINNPAQRMALRESIKTIATRLGVGYKVYEKETQRGHFNAHIRDNVYVEEGRCREVREVLSGFSGIPGSWREPRVDRRVYVRARACVCTARAPCGLSFFPF